jgi:putative phosphoesterase
VKEVGPLLDRVRVAVIYDVHANLPALEAVLAEIRRQRVDHLVVGGDVLPGPMPSETLDTLFGLALPVTFIHGNGDRVVLQCLGGSEIEEVPDQFRDAIRWTARQLRPEHQEAVRSWPPICRMEVSRVGEVLFCHATPRNDSEIFTRATSEDRLAPIFEEVQADIVVCGHTHVQFDRNVGGVRIVNAGSVGQPFQQPPGAYWLLLGPDIELRHTPYDVQAAAERLRRTGYPMVETLAVRYVLEPPSEAETLEMFSSAELQ